MSDIMIRRKTATKKPKLDHKKIINSVSPGRLKKPKNYHNLFSYEQDNEPWYCEY